MTAMNARLANGDFDLTKGLGKAAMSSLSWSREEGERLRMLVITVLALLFFVPLAIVIPILDVPEPAREQVESLPPQLAKLLVEPKPVEKPVPEPVKEVVEPEPEPAEPEPVKPEPIPEPEVAKPAPLPPVQPVEQTPKPVKQTVEQAREKASRSGLLSMRDRLASMRQPAPTAAPVIQANADTTAESISGASSSAQQVNDALKSSGGVKDAQAPRAEVAVAGHDVRKVEAVAQPEPVTASTTVGTQKSSGGERAMSNIRKVFDSSKTALYSLYQRELRKDPTLAGRVMLELVIEPDGSVSACKVVSSELENPALEQKIAMRVRLFNFGAANVETRKVRFPIDFLPG
ncbi:AgmX/PglI C-terminal domain-containing protein [Marinobacter sp. S6332]|uniref:AgmX/PglI C-terminal domain-containing protein n=1 Tax=Marinobacter sp. S6332 TaxID=2926403 RepID=UPI001FF16B4F|nr:AgmX/PglI C-terminal domain-containing protein [Marinobacter sp. S6332]MCK0164022.1 AgmX/PglI C-terminal domain-containing protein [Marinobacter sp. S6332]